MNMKLIKETENGKTYKDGDLRILYRKKGSIAGDNSENVRESIYFINGSAEITSEEKIWTVESPEKIEFPAKTYHKIEALTDISFIVFDD